MNKKEIIEELKKALKKEPQNDFLKSLERSMNHWSEIEASLKGRSDIVEQLRQINDKYAHVEEMLTFYNKKKKEREAD